MVININEEKALAWLSKGAKLSDTAKALFNKAGVLKKTAEEG